MRFSRLVMPPVAPSFPPCRKRWGRKGALVTVWCVLRLRFRQVLIFGYYEHTYSPYECYGTRRLLRDTRFVSRCVKIAAVNQLCVQILQDSTDSPQIPKAGGDMLQGSECSGIYGIRIPSGPSAQLLLIPRGAFFHAAAQKVYRPETNFCMIALSCCVRMWYNVCGFLCCCADLDR